MVDVTHPARAPLVTRAAAAPKSGLHQLMRRRSTTALLMCAPLIVIITGLVIYPAGYSMFLSTLNKAQTKFVGLDNFTFLLKRDVFQMVVWQ